MSKHALELEPDIKVLRAKAENSLPDCVVDDESQYDKTNDDGEKTREVPIRGPGGKTFETNVTTALRPGASMTGDVDLLALEAEMQASDEYTIENAHVPITTDVRDRALERIEAAGHSPAWEQ